eukprot:scaffold35182_cov56-Phaeocystis_antarctica.AAC.2
MRATIEGGGRARMGYDWQVPSPRDPPPSLGPHVSLSPTSTSVLVASAQPSCRATHGRLLDVRSGGPSILTRRVPGEIRAPHLASLPPPRAPLPPSLARSFPPTLHVRGSFISLPSPFPPSLPPSSLLRGGEEAECQPSHFMSRLYNARPYDCSTCSADYVTKVKIAPTRFHPNFNRSPNPALTLLTLSRTPNPTLTLTLALPLLNPITLILTPILTLTRSRSCTTPVAPSHGGTPGRICSDAPPTAAAALGWRLALPTGRCDGTWHATRSVVRGRRTSGCNCQTAVSESWAWRVLKRRRMHHFWYRVASRDVVWLLVTKYLFLFAGIKVRCLTSKHPRGLLVTGELR